MPVSYKDQLKSPEWQKKRLKIFERDDFTCQLCLDNKEQLHVHHKSYDKNTKAWEYNDDRLVTLCATCHEAVTAHIEQFGNEDEFAVLKIKSQEGLPFAIIYSKGNITFSKEIIGLTENTTHKLVQFLINNWLKNG